MRVLFRSIAQRVVIEYRSAGRAKKEDLQPRLTLLDDQSGEAARYLLAVGTMLSVEDGQEVQAGDVLARVSREASKTRDITGGLPRVAELFEARIPKDNSVIAKISGRIEFVKDYKAKRKIAIVPEEGDAIEYLIPKSKVLEVQEGDQVKRGDALISGRSEEHTSELQSLIRISYAVFCLKKTKTFNNRPQTLPI